MGRCTNSPNSTNQIWRSILIALIAVVVARFGPNACLAEIASDSSKRDWFEKRIRPVLANKCVQCHGAQKQEANLRLDSLSGMLKGGESGPAITMGDPSKSLLVDAINYRELEMPPDERLSEREIRDFESWVAKNAFWPEADELTRERFSRISEEDRQWWSFQPLTKPEVPIAEGDNWSQNPIDRFVFRNLAQHGMRPGPPAEKEVLLRRLYFDLIGLPPTPEQIVQFVNDRDKNALERVIDMLLASDHYGEHWARYWLDVVRYAESDGWNQDAYRPHIWQYRDYVVKAFNNDLPYPMFVRQQLAGDEMPGDEPEHLVATGFLRLGIYEYNQKDATSHWNDVINEMTDVTADVFLGMGMACARCHDHKFDPILRHDYFKLRAFFEPIIWRDDLPRANRARKEAYQQQLAIWNEATAAIQSRIAAIKKPYIDRKRASTVDKFPLNIQACFNKPESDRNSWEHQMAYLVRRQIFEEGGGPLKNMKKEDRQRLESLQRELAKYDQLKPEPLAELMTVTDFPGPIAPTVIPDDPTKTPVEPGFPRVLARATQASSVTHPDLPNSSGRRTVLARWIGDADNPLSTRVIVNRIWQKHFGQGIVPSANDFGRLGDKPTHPQLLDWLTSTFVDSGWSIKHLHKVILLSATWQQSATHPNATEYQEKDPSDSLIWRARIRRLTAEQIRDAMLTASGEVDEKLGGPSVSGQTPRRSLYVKRFRNTHDEFLHAFDVANGLKSTSQRNVTTTPTQSLLMMNGDFVLARANAMADQLLDRKLQAPRDIVDYACLLVWGRRPTPSESTAALQMLNPREESEKRTVDRAKLVDLCHVLFNSSEFMYVD